MANQRVTAAYQPRWTKGLPGGSEILDRNLREIANAISGFGGEIQDLRTTVVNITGGGSGTTTVNGVTVPPGLEMIGAGDDGGDMPLVIPGPAGAPGRDGRPAFGMDGDSGEDGWQGPPGLAGAVGARGFQGQPGNDGEDGQDAFPAGNGGSMARVWVSTQSPAFPYGVDMGALGTGPLQQSVTAGVATPSVFSWPLANRVLVSPGTTSPPVGNSAFQWDIANRVLYIGDGAQQSWSNLGDLGVTPYERVTAAWVANVWSLKSETSGGTVRSMKIDADTATLTLKGNAGLSLTSSNLTITSETGGTGHNLTVTGNGTDGQLFLTSWKSFLMSTVGNCSVSGDNLNMDVQGSPTLASAAALVLDGVRLKGGATVTGLTNIATAGGFNHVVVPRPSIVKGDALGAITVTSSASFYITNSPLAGADITITNAYALWVDAGLSRFDGNGTHVFELPADATGNVSAATGRVPINIGGATKYLRYFND